MVLSLLSVKYEYDVVETYNGFCACLHNMKINKILLLSFILLTGVLSGCGDPEKEPQVGTEVTNVTLIYAVNHNNLASDLIQNRNQILNAASSFNPITDKVLLYSYESGGCTLKELIYGSSGPEFKVIKNYEKGVLSTTPDRITEVIEYVAAAYPACDKTLFLWGHGLGPVNPSKYSHLPADPVQKSSLRSTKDDILFSFGGEYIDDISGKMDYIDLDKLSESIPSGMFRTIWFDCCYMSSIEVAYQLRNKCRYFVAYPTEIYRDGLPYHKVLPYTVGETPDLVYAAKELFDLYNTKGYAVTVSVMDLSKIEQFAESVKDYVSKLEKEPDFTDIVNYSRLTMPRPNSSVKHPYYDLIGWLRKGADNSPELRSKFNALKSAYNNMMIYTASGTRDFNGHIIDPEGYFGISFYPYNNDNSQRDNYYHKLDWWQDVACHYGWLK